MIRAFQITFICCLCFYVVGCKSHQQSEPRKEQVKIADLAPAKSDKTRFGRSLKTINFDIHIFEIPADNINRLHDLWQMLYIQPMRFNSFKAFQRNSLLIGYGQMRMWTMVNEEISTAGGKKIATASLLLTDGQPYDFTIDSLNRRQSISFISTDGSNQGATIGPGILTLRLKADKSPQTKDGCQLEVYPVFTVPLKSPIEELTSRSKLREFVFSPAGFGLQMGIGDFVVFGPQRYISLLSTLDGLLFSKPQGSLFIDAGGQKTPAVKPAVRIFVFLYKRINY